MKLLRSWNYLIDTYDRNLRFSVSLMADMIIRNGRIVSMNPAFPSVFEGTVVIEDGKISDVVKGETTETAEKIIDAKGGFVMPGLSNTHTHLGMTLFRGYADDMALTDWLQNKIWPAEGCMTAKEMKAGCRLACLEMIKSGTTACCDMYLYMDETARVIEESGMRAALSYGMIDFGDMERADKLLREAQKFVADWNGAANGRITTMYGPHSPVTCSEEFLTRVREQATKDGAGIHIHILETKSEMNEIKKRTGMSEVDYLDRIGFWGPDVLAAHSIWISDKDIGLFAGKGVNVSHTPISNMKLSSGLAPVRKMMDAGVNVSLGTDGCASNNSLDLFEEIKIASLIHNASKNPITLPVERALKAATVNGGLIIDKNTGMIKKGNKADVIVIDIPKARLMPDSFIRDRDLYSYLAYAVCGSNVRTVVIDGKIVMEDRIVLTMDEEKVCEDTEKAVAELYDRVSKKMRSFFR